MAISRKVVVLAILSLFVLAVCQDTSFSQERRRGGGGRRGGGFGGGSPLELVLREEVREELELIDDQITDLEKLSASQRDRARAMFTQLREAGGGGQQGGFERIGELMQKINAETSKELDKILLPHQSKRLGQLAFQRRMRGGSAQALLNEEVSKQLGISESQREQLRKKAEQIEREAQKRIAQIRRESQKQLLSSLTSAQKAQFEELSGEPFEFRQSPPGEGRPRFGGQGGGRRRGGEERKKRPQN